MGEVPHDDPHQDLDEGDGDADTDAHHRRRQGHGDPHEGNPVDVYSSHLLQGLAEAERASTSDRSW